MKQKLTLKKKLDEPMNNVMKKKRWSEMAVGKSLTILQKQRGLQVKAMNNYVQVR
jgi:hypothetical protein